MFLLCVLKFVKFEEKNIDKDYRFYVLKIIYNYIDMCERKWIDFFLVFNIK